MKSDNTLHSLSSKRKCVTCGVQHHNRHRRPGWCLTCDILDRAERGVAVAEIAAIMELPDFLIEAVTLTKR